MKGNMLFSALLLERYHLGEVTAEERAALEAALAEDPALAASLAALEQSDREIRRQYPRTLVFPERPRKPLGGGLPAPVWGLCAAALILAVALPALFLLRGPAGFAAGSPLMDRIKGNAGVYGPEGSFAELSVYLKSGPRSGQEPEEAVLPDGAVLHEGNTIQLAYMVSGKAEQYGVIFSIDGRSALTVHYPYREGQSARLITGRRIALEEAYTLDDAPEYEIFFFVVSDRPLDPGEILKSAGELARNPAASLEAGKRVFQQYLLRTIKIRKE